MMVVWRYLTARPVTGTSHVARRSTVRRLIMRAHPQCLVAHEGACSSETVTNHATGNVIHERRKVKLVQLRFKKMRKEGALLLPGSMTSAVGSTPLLSGWEGATERLVGWTRITSRVSRQRAYHCPPCCTPHRAETSRTQINLHH